MTAATLIVKDLSWAPGRGRDTLLHSTSFDLKAGRVLGIVGPNGAGKTTLLRLLYRYYRPTSGRVNLDGQDIWSLSAQSVAQRIAAVLQEQPNEFALTVTEIVALGRTPHTRGFAGTLGSDDFDVVAKALDRLDLQHLKHRHLGTLSGGERQRVMVARALAQEPRLLILDEPTNHLDIRHQLEILELMRDLPLTIVASLHDLNLAAATCDDILLLNSGRTIGCGPPAEVLNETAIAQAFQVRARRESLSQSGLDHFTFRLKTNGEYT